MSSTDVLTRHLSAEDRRRLDTELIAFEREWDETHLAVRVAALPPAGDVLRAALLVGMVCIDLRRRWQCGQAVTVERYLGEYPELGTAETVAIELVREEHEARQRHGAPADLAQRFPIQARQLWQHLEQTRELTAPQEPGSPGAATLPPDSAQGKSAAGVPEAFGRYRIVRQLGRGGMGTVYLAQDTQLDRPVALKVPHFTSEDTSARERFYREARIAATLDHPNLCPIHDVGQHEGVPYLTMPYIEGTPLSEALVGTPGASQRDIASLVRRLALALEEAHRRGIIHRDLKPSNIMMNRRGEPVVMDFGLARQAAGGDVRLTQTGAIVGTPAYMSPEQVDGAIAQLGPPCDVYSLGVILYELLCGRLPFQGSTSQVLCQILRDNPPRPSSHRHDIDGRLERICLKAMAKPIKDRYQSMTDFAADLDQFLLAPEKPEPPILELVEVPRRQAAPPDRTEIEPLLDALPADPRPAPRRGRRWPRMMLGCLALVLLVCGGPIGLLMVIVPKMAEKMGESIKDGFYWVGGELTRQSEWNGLAARWKAPPADAPPDALFPARLGEYERSTLGMGVPLAEYNLETQARKAVYRGREGEVELYALRATSLEREALFKRLLDDLEKRQNTRKFVQGSADSYRIHFSLGSPEEKGMLWWNQNWLFVAFTRDAIDVDALLRTYLDLISRGAGKG